MPTDPESLIIYAIVLLTLVWLTRNLWRRKAKGPGPACGHGCGKATSRHPAIQKILDRRDRS